MLHVFSNIDSILAVRLCLIIQKHIVNSIERKIRYKFSISSILATLGTNFFKFLLASYTRRIKAEKYHKKNHYTFRNKTVYFKNNCVQKLTKARTLLSASTFLHTVIIFWGLTVPLYCFSSRLDTLGARSWNARFLSSSLSVRFLYQVVCYCLVCIVTSDLLCVGCCVFGLFDRKAICISINWWLVFSWNVRKSS